MGYEEEHVCPCCHMAYVVSFTSLGKPNTEHFQRVPITVRPTQKKRMRQNYFGADH
jgi:hypothetical protein